MLIAIGNSKYIYTSPHQPLIFIIYCLAIVVANFINVFFPISNTRKSNDMHEFERKPHVEEGAREKKT